LRPEDRDWELAQAIDPARLPEHIAIIMDGNGRWPNGGGCRVWRPQGGIGPVRSTWKPAHGWRESAHAVCVSVETGSVRARSGTLWRLLRYYLRQELPSCKRTTFAASHRRWKRCRSRCAPNWTRR